MLQPFTGVLPEGSAHFISAAKRSVCDDNNAPLYSNYLAILFAHAIDNAKEK